MTDYFHKAADLSFCPWCDFIFWKNPSRPFRNSKMSIPHQLRRVEWWPC